MKKSLFRLQYELDSNSRYNEAGSEKGAKVYAESISDEEVRYYIQTTQNMSHKEMLKWLQQHTDLNDKVVVLPLTTRTPEALRYRTEGRHPKLIYVMRPLHTIEMLDDFLYVANEVLDNGAYLSCHAMTAALKRELLAKQYPWGVRHVVIAFDYLWHRVCPKLRLTHGLYFTVTQGKDRTCSRVELLGRLYRAGFEVIDEQFRGGEFFLLAQKAKAPVDDTPPTGSPIIHLRRIGKGGKEIVVHKFRTMYAYSEYLQPYIYQYQRLERGGKFKDDYRVNFWGHLLRRSWLDELPMLWNLLRGDIKLVGVRPLSPQYFSLYTPELQRLRTQSKPGLLPPFYYEQHSPETLDEVQESERRYLEAYLKKPFATDWKYFWGIMGNILFRRKRSK